MKTSELGLSAIYRILKKKELRKVIEDIAVDIAKNAVDMTKHAGRKTVRSEDVKLASRTFYKH